MRAVDGGMIDRIRSAIYGTSPSQSIDIKARAESWLQNGVLQLPRNFNEGVGIIYKQQPKLN